jgi:hypothetical protein
MAASELPPSVSAPDRENEAPAKIQG